jgi:(S)-sulfolactate dehydrogenase
MRVVISEFMATEAVDRLRETHDVVFDADLVDREADLLHAAATCDALIVRNRTQVRGALLAALGQARVIGRLGVGLDNIDVKGCRDRGIEVIPATGANATAVAEYVLACALDLVRAGAYGRSRETLDGKWPRALASRGGELLGRTLGLVGFGQIAREVGRRARAFGMEIVAHDPYVANDDPAWGEEKTRSVEIAALLEISDVISLHVPLTDATRNMIDAGALARMRPSAILINTSRGGIVDEAALAAALTKGFLGGAAIDVFADEPLAGGSPLAAAPNLIATPHIAGVTLESNVRVSNLIANKVISFLSQVPNT